MHAWWARDPTEVIVKVTPSFFGPIRKPTTKGPVQLAPGATLGDLLAALEYPPEHWNGILAIRNGQRLTIDTPLEDGDQVELTIRVGGG